MGILEKHTELSIKHSVRSADLKVTVAVIPNPNSYGVERLMSYAITVAPHGVVAELSLTITSFSSL